MNGVFIKRWSRLEVQMNIFAGMHARALTSVGPSSRIIEYHRKVLTNMLNKHFPQTYAREESIPP